MRYFFLIIFAISSFSTFGSKIDSLQHELIDADDTTRVLILNELFKVYRNNDPSKALGFSIKALEQAESIGFKKGKAQSLNAIGIIYKGRGNYSKALDFYLRSLAIHKEVKNYEGAAFSLSNIGTVYSLKGNYDKALEYYDQSKSIFDSLNMPARIINVLNNIGNIYNDQNNDEKALLYYNKALELYRNIEKSNTAEEPLSNIGNIHFKRGEYSEALKYYDRSLEVEQLNKNKFGQAYTLSHIGLVYQEKGDFPTAVNYQMRALDIANKIDAKPLLINIYKSLAQCHHAIGNLELAYKFLLLNSISKDVVYKQINNNMIAEMEVELELQQQRNTIDYLKKEKELTDLQINYSRIIILFAIMAAIFIIGITFFIIKKQFKL